MKDTKLELPTIKENIDFEALLNLVIFNDEEKILNSNANFTNRKNLLEYQNYKNIDKQIDKYLKLMQRNKKTIFTNENSSQENDYKSIAINKNRPACTHSKQAGLFLRKSRISPLHTRKSWFSLHYFTKNVYCCQSLTFPLCSLLPTISWVCPTSLRPLPTAVQNAFDHFHCLYQLRRFFLPQREETSGQPCIFHLFGVK